MLDKVGLLDRGNNENVPFAYRCMPVSKRPISRWQSVFKETFSRYITVHFVGVWYTQAIPLHFCFELLMVYCWGGIWSTPSVLSVQRSFPLPVLISADNHIRFFGDAVSLDERRAKVWRGLLCVQRSLLTYISQFRPSLLVRFVST
jgi:Uncharacterized alpha/beta hydrolase domain (DUF2235)